MLRLLGVALFALGALVTAPSPRAPSPAPDRLYVADLRSSDVATVDLGSHKTVRRQPVALDPHEVTESGQDVWVSDYRSALVTVLPRRGAAQRLPVAGEPHGLAVINHVVAVTQGRLGSVALLDAATGSLLAEVDTGGEPHIVLAAGQRFYVADAARGRVLTIDPATATVAGAANVGDEPEALSLSPDGSTLAVANARSRSISLLSLPDLSETARLPMPGTPVRTAFSPDGSTLAVSLNDAESVLLLRLSDGSRSLIPAGRLPDGLAYTPDGRFLYVALSGENHVAELDLRQRRVLRRITVGDGPSGLLLVRGGR